MPTESPYYHDIGLCSLHTHPDVMPESHRHMEIELNFLECGSMTYLRADGLQTVTDGNLIAFWGTFPHQLVNVSAGAHFFCIYIPFARFLTWDLPGSFPALVLNGSLAIDMDPANSTIDRVMLTRWHEELTVLNPENEKTIYLELEARMRRMAQSIERYKNDVVLARATHGAHKHSSDLINVQTMIGVIADRYASELSAVDVAEAVGLHPKYAMSLFSKTLGVTMLTYIKQHRLSHAQRLLATTDAKIAHIAYDAGFGSLTRFYEIFREMTGESPTDYRRRITENSPTTPRL